MIPGVLYKTRYDTSCGMVDFIDNKNIYKSSYTIPTPKNEIVCYLKTDKIIVYDKIIKTSIFLYKDKLVTFSDETLEEKPYCLLDINEKL